MLADAIEAAIGPREDRDPDARLFAASGADALRTSMAKACRAFGIPLVSLHDLRHRRISLLHLRGVPWARIGKQSASATSPSQRTPTDETELNYHELSRSPHDGPSGELRSGQPPDEPRFPP